MKIKYNSIWSKIYRFGTGNSNEEMTTDFFQYWFVIIISTLTLPFTLPTLIIDKFLPEIKWNFMLRFFVGLFLWALLGAFGLIYYALNLKGNLVVLWTIGFYLFSGLFILYLCTVQFPVVGDRIVHIVYLILNYVGLLYSKLTIKPVIEYDKVDIYIIIDINKFNGFIEKYEDIIENNMMHVVVPIKGCNIDEYPRDKYIVYTGIKYGDKINLGKLVEDES